MTPTSLFSLQPLTKRSEPALSRLLVEGASRGPIVPGRWMEAQLAGDGFFLLFITHDCPYEEQLDICLIDTGFAMLDDVSLCWMYSTGRFRNLTVRSDRIVAFNFYGGVRWVVEVLRAPVRHFPLLGGPKGVWRKFGFSRQLAISTEPDAAEA
jgi:hypothetical protein